MCNVTKSLVFLIGLIFCSSAHAALVSYNFTAELTSATGTPTGGSLVDTADGFLIITGSVSYDTAAAPNLSAPNYQSYLTGTIEIDQFSVTSLFQYAYSQDNSGQNFGIVHQGIGGPTTLFHLQDSSNSLYTGLDLPAALFLTEPVAEIIFSEGLLGSDPSVTFTITSLNSPVSAVPIPGALPLFMGGLAGLAVIRRRKRLPE